MSDPLARLELLVDPDRCAGPPVRRQGWLDAGTAPAVSTRGQRLMRSGAYAEVYQTIRPLGYRLAGIGRAPGPSADRARAVRLLRLHAGSTVLDVGCGPGNFTGPFGEVVGVTGLAIGLDASTPMLTRAVREHSGPGSAYLRADATRVPLADGSVDAVSCFGALYLVDDPRAALAEQLRVLRPGGVLAVVTTHPPSPAPLAAASRAAGWASGIRVFGHDEVVGLLRELGAVTVHRRVEGLAQLVTARRTAPGTQGPPGTAPRPGIPRTASPR